MIVMIQGQFFHVFFPLENLGSSDFAMLPLGRKPRLHPPRLQALAANLSRSMASHGLL